MNKLLIIALSLVLVACSPEPEPTMSMGTSPEVHDSKRIKVERIGVFVDDLAYSERRGIYIIKDSETGNQYLGVSGIGITELGLHSCGKGCVRQDER